MMQKGMRIKPIKIYRLWSHLFKIYKPKPFPFSKLTVDTRIISDEKEITHELYKYFSDWGKAPEIDSVDPHDNQITSEYKEHESLMICTIDTNLDPKSITEIKLFIRKVNGKKSLGFDQVSNFIIELLPSSYTECSVKCFHFWLRKGEVCRFLGNLKDHRSEQA